MKNNTPYDPLRDAQVGYLSKDEYRDLQQSLITDAGLMERASQILLSEVSLDLTGEKIPIHPTKINHL